MGALLEMIVLILVNQGVIQGTAMFVSLNVMKLVILALKVDQLTNALLVQTQAITRLVHHVSHVQMDVKHVLDPQVANVWNVKMIFTIMVTNA